MMKKIASSLLHIALMLALLRQQQQDNNNILTSGDEYDVTLGQSYILSLTNPRQYLSHPYQQYPHYPIRKNTILRDVFSLRPADGVYQQSVVTMLVDSCECDTAACATGASASWNSCISKEDMVMIDEILSADELTTQITPLLSHDAVLSDAASDSGVSSVDHVTMVTESPPPTVSDDLNSQLLLADMLLPALTNDSFSFPLVGESSANNLLDGSGLFSNVSGLFTGDNMAPSLSRQTSRLSDLFTDEHLLDFLHTEIDPDVVNSLLAEPLDDITNTDPCDWLLPDDDNCPPMPCGFEWFNEDEQQRLANADDDIYNKYKPCDDITLPPTTASSIDQSELDDRIHGNKHSASEDEGYFGTNDAPDHCVEGATGIDKNKLSKTKGHTDNGDEDVYRTDSDGQVSPSSDSVWHNHTYHNTDITRRNSRTRFLKSHNNTHPTDYGLLGQCSKIKPSPVDSMTPSTGRLVKRRKKDDHVISKKVRLTDDEIIHLPIDELNNLLDSHQLTDQQRVAIRNIRRRGKNKMAAQNCRKRKMETISGLSTVVAKLRQRKQMKYNDMRTVRQRLEEANRRYDAIYSQVTRLIEHSNRHHANTIDLTLYQLANGEFVLRPSYQGNNDVNNEASSTSKPQSKL